MKSDGIQKILVTLLCSLLAVILAYGVQYLRLQNTTERTLKIGFIYVGDLSDAYTSNFAKAQREIESRFAGQVETLPKYNVPEDSVEPVLEELAQANCDLIFTTSYGYGEATKQYAGKYPQIQFCQATCNNAGTEPVYSNYHTFMGRIFEGRYVSGVVAGKKLSQLIDQGKLTPEQAKIGYIGAFPLAEVISGYTAFFLGVRSVVPEATMTVRYTHSWSDYHLEKSCAQTLIQEGCVIISQHSDTSGPAAACEETDRSQIVYYVSYNESMWDIAPTTYLTGSRINWIPYMTGAVEALLADRRIEDTVRGTINGNDIGSGFENDWVQMLELNSFIVPEGTQETIDQLIGQFRRNQLQVFRGDYIGVNPNDPTDTINLAHGYNENGTSSAPSFCYVLEDVITIG